MTQFPIQLLLQAGEFDSDDFRESRYRPSKRSTVIDSSIFLSSVSKMSDIYCAEQIKIPPTFAHILKQYAKAAIRTQPYDLLQWTCAYFRALVKCDVPPVKVNATVPNRIRILRLLLLGTHVSS